MTGQQLLDFLEFSSAAYPEESGAFLSVSGLEYTIDSSIKSSVKLNEYGGFISVDGEYRVKNVLVGGEKLDLNKTYTVASIRYLLKEGGDGFIMSGKCDVYDDTSLLDVFAAEKYLNNELGGNIPDEYRNPEGQGRINITDGTETPEKSSPESSEPEISKPESAEPVHEDSTKTNSEISVSEKPVPNADNLKTGDASSASTACLAVIISLLTIAVFSHSRKKQM